MTKQKFKKLLSEQLVYLDGATGSNLMKRGMPAGVCPETWIMEHKDIMLQLQREYVEAGSHIIFAPTFTSNSIKLAEYGLQDQIEEINHTLVAISKEAAGDKAFVAGDITMTGKQLAPIGQMGFEELIDVYKEQISYLADAGVDLLVVETMMSLQESRAALIAAKEVCDLPVMVTMTFEANGRCLFGTDAKTAAIVLSGLGAVAIGANCSTGPDKMISIIKEMRSVTAVPIIAKPNAGLPALDKDGNTVYDMPADVFATEMIQMVEAGATVLGGCCGTSPEYIKALVTQTKHMQIPNSDAVCKRFLTSERQTVAFGLDDAFLIVGERINPTGKKALQAELKEGNLDMVERFAQEQEACGASILDINMGMSGIDEKEMMLKVLDTVSEFVSLPLAIDSSHVDVVEAALRKYPGRALMNSISLETQKCDKMLALAKKYGAMFILLPLSDSGLPKDLDEKKKIIHTILDKALALGMSKEDIIVDGLVTTVGANKSGALEALETIKYCKELSLATICGLSNISFGLPERSYVNTTFLTMAIQTGLTMAIANPSQQLLMASAFASDLLLNKEGSDIRYIEAMSAMTERTEKEAAAKRTVKEAADKKAEKESADKRTTKEATDKKTAKASADNAAAKEIIDKKSIAEERELGELSQKAQNLRDIVLKGNRKAAADMASKVIEEGAKAQDILNDILLPAINAVGELFDKGKYFLPQLIASAEAMKNAIEYLEPMLLSAEGGQQMPAVVIATVKGDIHDIGKNLVALMLKNHGFQVLDLGKDVSKEEIIKAAKEHNAKIIALSALMTTTMQEMRHVVTYAKEQGIDSKIIIGGAVITQDYADEIGADGYSKDAAEAVKLSKRLLGL